MTVKELIDILQILPQDYKAVYDAYGYTDIDDIEVTVKDKLVIIK